MLLDAAKYVGFGIGYRVAPPRFLKISFLGDLLVLRCLTNGIELSKQGTSGIKACYAGCILRQGSTLIFPRLRD